MCFSTSGKVGEGRRGQGSPRRVLRVRAAPSANDGGKYPPSSTAQTRPPASDIRECVMCAKQAGLTACSPSGHPTAGSYPADI